MGKDLCVTFRFASFSSVTDNHIKKLSFFSDAPEWRVIHPGLNLEGRCKNHDCAAYNNSVWSSLGYGQFHMSYYIKNTPCVKCGKNLKKVEAAGVYKCTLRGKGRKAKEGDETDSSDEEEEETVFQYTTNEHESFLKFGDMQKQIILWQYLILTATESKKPPQNKLRQPRKLKIPQKTVSLLSNQEDLKIMVQTFTTSFKCI